MNEQEKNFFCVFSLQDAVNQGGFDEYYRRKVSDHAELAKSAFLALGLTEIAALTDKASALFPGETPSKSQQERVDQLDDMDEETANRMDDLDVEFYKREINFDRVLYDYIIQNRIDFQIPD